MKNGKRNSIGQKTIIGIIVFTILLVIAVSLPVSFGFTVFSRNYYYEDTRDFAGIVSHVVDGDVIAGYVETGEKDQYYHETEVFLTSLCDEVDLTDVSIYAPAGDEAIYVWDSIDEFVGDAPQFDDITMLAFRYNGKQ